MQPIFPPIDEVGDWRYSQGNYKETRALGNAILPSEKRKCVQQFTSSASTVKSNSWESRSKSQAPSILLGSLPTIPSILLPLEGRNDFPRVTGNETISEKLSINHVAQCVYGNTGPHSWARVHTPTHNGI